MTLRGEALLERAYQQIEERAGVAARQRFNAALALVTDPELRQELETAAGLWVLDMADAGIYQGWLMRQDPTPWLFAESDESDAEVQP